MFRARLSGFHLAEGVAWAAFAVCLRQLFGLFEARQQGMFYLFNSDSLFLADIIQDIRHGDRLADWSLPHAVFVVPDLTLWGLAALMAPSLQWTILLFGTLQAMLGAWFTRMLVVRQHGQATGALAPAAYCLVFAFIAGGKLIEALDIIKPLHHFGVALTALAGFWLVAAWFKTYCWSRLALLAVLVGAGCLSDPFTLTCAAAPVATVLMVAVVRSRAGRKKNLLAFAAVAATAVGGSVGAKALTDVVNDVAQFRVTGVPAQWALLGTALQSLRFDIPDVLAVLGLIAMAMLFIRGLFRMREPGLGATLDVAPAVAAGANLAMLLVTGNVVHVLFNRYQIVIFALLVLTLVRVIASMRLLWRPPIGAAIIASLATFVALGAAVSMTHRLWGLSRMSLGSWRPPATECLIDAASQQDAWRGIGDFWNARLYSLLNGKGLRVEQVDGNGSPQRWLNNTKAYADRRPAVAFAMMSRLNPDSIRQTYGPPATIVSCGDEVMWFWDSAQRETITRTLNTLPLK